MSYQICEFTNGVQPLEDYHFYEETREELKRLQSQYPDCKFGIEEVPDVEDIENDCDY